MPKSTEEMPQWSTRPDTSAGLLVLYLPELPVQTRVHVLSLNPTLIGRERAEAPICLPGRFVSARHAEIAQIQGQWQLRDVGSRNGTRVDGHYILGPVVLEHLQLLQFGDCIVKFIAHEAEQYAAYERAKSTLEIWRPIPRFVGGYQIQQVVEALRPAACSDVLILGETGTGKELAAETAHEVHCPGHPELLLPVNTAALSSDLLPAELFGHSDHAFTGAAKARVGLVRSAEGGTLFLDEIGDMQLHQQPSLLRLLREREVRAVGTDRPKKIANLRVVCATNRNLDRMVEEGLFRKDLLARIRKCVVRLPPLRERKEDLVDLVQVCLNRLNAKVGLSSDVWGVACHYEWPDNVRELFSAVEHAVGSARGPEIGIDDLPTYIVDAMASYLEARPGERRPDPLVPPSIGLYAPTRRNTDAPEQVPAPIPKPRSQEDLERIAIQCRGNVTTMARTYGTHRNTVQRWLDKFDIKAENYRGKGTREEPEPEDPRRPP